MSSRYSRLLGTRQQQLDYLRTQGWQIVRIKALPVLIAFKPNADGQGAVFLKAWRGAADRFAFYNHYRSMATAEACVAHYLENVRVSCERRADQTAERKARRDALKASDHWTEGDVFYNSWGYDQTNIDWYQIVEVKAKSVVIRAIAKNYKETAYMSGDSQPRRNEFTGSPVVKQLDEAGRISMRHGAVSKWDGSSAHETHYA